MNHLIVTAAISLTVMLIADAASAGPRNERVGRTEGRQGARINQGVRSGELTREEAKGLRQENRAINRARKDARRDDGHIDKQEMKEIRKDQKELSKDIYKEKHDDQKRGE
jgi:hypothetical protein